MQQLADSGQDMDLRSTFEPVLQVPPSVITEIEQLHVEVCQLQAQDNELQAWSKRQAVGMTVALDCGSACLREAFKPMCNEEVVQWMRDRQASMHDTS